MNKMRIAALTFLGVLGIYSLTQTDILESATIEIKRVPKQKKLSRKAKLEQAIKILQEIE